MITSFAKLIDLASFVPDMILDNASLSDGSEGLTPEKIEAKTGIVRRHIAGNEETALDLAERACLKLFQKGACHPLEIQAVIFCTQSPDYPLPPNCCLLQSRLNLRGDIMAFDFSHGCSGFVYGLSLAKVLIEGGMVENVLLVTAETYSKYLAQADYAVRTIFGDAACATFIKGVPSERPFLDDFVFATDGSGARHLIVPRGGAKDEDSMDESLKTDILKGHMRTLENLYMNGPAIFNYTLDAVPGIFNAILEKSALCAGDIDLFIFHQANKFMLDHLRQKLKIEADRFFVHICEVGNTVSASIPLAMEQAEIQGKLKQGSQVMLIGFGVGLSAAGCLMRV